MRTSLPARALCALALLLLFSGPLVAHLGAQTPIQVRLVVANAGSTGTTLNKLAKLTGAPSTAVRAATTDTGGIIGVVIAGAGTSGNAVVQLASNVSCVFDGATTAGDYVQVSSSTGGDCHDAGASFPSSGQVLGRVLSTNGSGGTYSMDLFPAEIDAGANAGTGTQYGETYWSSSSALGSTTPPTVDGNYTCGYQVTGGVALAPTCNLIGLAPRAVTGSTSSDTILYSDDSVPVVYEGSVAVAVSLPTPTSLGNSNFLTILTNNTSGSATAVTVTATTLTFASSASTTLTIAQGQTCSIWVDPGGSVWDDECHDLPLVAGAGISLTRGAYGPTISTPAGTRSFGTSFGDTGGSALTSGSVVYRTVPYACTIAAWNITVDAGTATIDIWKIASGTAIPTVTNTITASALPAISTGTAIHSTTLTSWTTSVTANDIFAFQLKTVATAKYVEIDLQCNQ